MTYKRLDELLVKLNHLSNPGMTKTVTDCFNELRSHMGNLEGLLHGKYLADIIFGYQYGYSDEAVAENIMGLIISSVTATISDENVVNEIWASLDRLDERHPFFHECQYMPSKEERYRDPLDVITEINNRRVTRQNAVNENGGGVVYPPFGTWVDQQVRIHNASEASLIKTFRYHVKQTMLTAAIEWFGDDITNP